MQVESSPLGIHTTTLDERPTDHRIDLTKKQSIPTLVLDDEDDTSFRSFEIQDRYEAREKFRAVSSEWYGKVLAWCLCAITIFISVSIIFLAVFDNVRVKSVY
jgi:hypothetical protein